MAYEYAIDTNLNTYAVKEELKALGCKWNPEKGAWMARDEAMYRRGVEIARTAGPKTYAKRRFRASSGNRAPGGRRCPMCGSRDCPRAWNSRDLCNED